VNLGRIARISRGPFQAAADEVLYLDRAACGTLLFADRCLSKAFIAERAQAALGQVLGYGEPTAAASPRQRGPDPGCDGGRLRRPKRRPMSGDPARYHAWYWSISMLRGALYVLLVGPGSCSLDRRMFGRRGG
jgi:hypothetical protein